MSCAASRVDQLVPSLSVENLLVQRAAIVERLRQAAGLLVEIDQLSQAAFQDAYASPSLECRRAHVAFPSGVEELVKQVDAAAWNHLLHKSGLWTFMDAASREQWQKAIHERRVPELTLANIQATFVALYDARREMFERGVVALFRKLSWDYKTNNPCRFGKRIIVSHIVDVWGSNGQRYVTGPSHGGCNALDDLLRVLSVLDGQPEPDHRQGAYHMLTQAFGAGRTIPVQPVELHGLFTVRCFRNGNGHITFLRSDLVEQMNQIVARHHPGALPPMC